MGNIHQSAINHDKLTPTGSSFAATADNDFLTSADGWFRPVSTQTGPDGALWIMDWYDKYPCYQNANADPEGVDREHGRIWRVVYTGGMPDAGVPPRPAGMDLGKMSSVDLVDLLSNPNIWQRRMARRLLTERRDLSSRTPLQKLLANGKSLDGRLGALWTLHGAEFLDDSTLDKFVDDKEPAIRTWVARLTGERQDASKKAVARLMSLARDEDPYVRTAVATATRQFVSGNLTVDTPPAPKTAKADPFPILKELLQNPSTTNDALYAHIIWMSAEPKVAEDAKPLFAILADKKTPLSTASSTVLKRMMRRILDTKDADKLNAVVTFLGTLEDKNPPLVSAALDGLIDAQKGKPVVPGIPTAPILAKLANSKTAGVPEKAQRLGALWGDASAAKAALARINDPKATDDERLRGIQIARELKEESARDALLRIVNTESKEALVTEAIRALGQVGGDEVADAFLQRWPQFTPAERRTGAEVLVSRKPWARALLSAVEKKQVAPSDVSATAVRMLAQNSDETIRQRAAKTIGRFRATDADKLKLIAQKKKVVLAETPDLESGHAVAQKTCLVCHKLHGEGADVGPDLTGVGRSTLDALLANVIDPNQVVGKGYENTEVETKDGRTVNGRIVEDTDTRLRLLASGPKEEIIAKSDIAHVRTGELSLMPEGLEQMPDADFRNLIWYILNPPQDKRPLTPALRRELIGDDATAQTGGKKPSASATPTDRESVALWNPEWRILCPDFEGAPAKLVQYAGRNNVLMTHPIDRSQPCALERSLTVPKSSHSVLSFYAAADSRGDWELHVLANGRQIHKELIEHTGEPWKKIVVPLDRYAGKKVDLRLENAANDWNYEFGYWCDIRIDEGEKRTAQK
jgi:putative heme-binding domain-containing protein